MQCDCGGSSDYEHRTVRDKVTVATYNKCPACGRIFLLTVAFPVVDPQVERRAMTENIDLF